MASQYSEVVQVKERILSEVEKHFPAAKNAKVILAVDKFLLGPVYYIEWNDSGEDDDNCFCYVLAHKEIEIYDDGIQIIQRMKQILDEKRTFLQRLGEFGFNDVVGAAIALMVIFFFFASSYYEKALTIDKELLGFLMLIAGFYFGKGK